MSSGSLNAQQIRSLVEDKWQRDLDALALGLHVGRNVEGPAEIEFGFGRAVVKRANSVLAIREALLDAEKQNRRVVLLTDLQQNELGLDVVGRLARSRLFAVDHWAGLCTLFKARELDRTVLEPAIAQALMEYAPAGGYPPVSAGLLDAGTVWRAVCRYVFDMGEREPDLVSLLLWATSERSTIRYRKADRELCESLNRRLIANLGESADLIIGFVEQDHARDALALAVCCQVVFGTESEPVLESSAARLERYHGRKLIRKAVGQQLGQIAAEAIADLDREPDPRKSQQHLQRADELLRELVCEDQAFRGSLTRRGFEQRLDRLGVAIRTAVSSPSAVQLNECENCLEQIKQHRFAELGRNQDQVARAEMAVRLVRWLQTPLAETSSFSDAAATHIRDWAFVDWAREPLCRGEDARELSAAYQLLDRAVLARREILSRNFALSLNDWTSVGSSNSAVLGVEHVLGGIVSRVVSAGNRVLFVVLDGMSWAICHELLEDIRQDHWFEATLEESNTIPVPVIATIPSVTNFSRASLLSGVLCKGDQNLEKRNFESHPHLVEQSDNRYPPKLFHKQDLTDGNRGMVSEELANTLTNPQQKVVGVVINAIDDRLSNAQQVIESWAISRINPLRGLLRLARDSGRVVILASDHGHVWHRPDGRCRGGDESSRWKSKVGSKLEVEELELSGSRVLAGGSSVIVPWSETIYYGRQQNGYHGGATPQEMVCPLVLLMDKTSTYSGLYQCEYPKPDWWAPAPIATAEVDEPSVTVIPSANGKKGWLFDLSADSKTEIKATKPASEKAVSKEHASDSDWVESLIQSETYQVQKSLVRRHAVQDDVLSTCLKVLHSSGGIMTPVAFAKAAEIPTARLDGLVKQIQRVLNLDGYEVLTLDRAGNKVELNLPRLLRQFGLE